MATHRPLRPHGLPLVFSLLLLVAGCAAVHVRDVKPHDAARAAHSDMSASGAFSTATRATLLQIALDADDCAREPRACERPLAASRDLDDERRLSALTELELLAAAAAERSGAPTDALGAYVDAARASYAYLFFTRSPAERAFEDRQAQVRSFYNRACEGFAALAFARGRAHAPADLDVGAWHVRRGHAELGFPQGDAEPSALVAVSRLRLHGIRSMYGRDGFGAAFVAIGATAERGHPDRESRSPRAAEHDQDDAFVAARYLAATVVLRFPGAMLADVLEAHEAIVDIDDPFTTATIEIGAHSVPLAANYTAPYALWLADSRFEREAGLALLRPVAGPKEPRIFFTQPYDPNRRTVVLLHGLGSSPEAWMNLANELIGDEELRARYQIWQVFYPTNLPIPESRRAISAALLRTFAALDPAGKARASHGVTLIGHSMGGVLAHLLLVESGDALWQDIFGKPADAQLRERYAMLAPYLDLEPLPQVDEAILLAAPHRGAPMARDWRGRVAALAVRLPVDVVDTLSTLADALAEDVPLRASALRRRRNSITNLSDRDDYLHATADLTVAPGVTLHSIIGRRDEDVPLERSSDGVVPYTSSHLDGAASELVVRSGHSVQNTPRAILEVRRILREKKET